MTTKSQDTTTKKKTTAKASKTNKTTQRHRAKSQHEEDKLSNEELLRYSSIFVLLALGVAMLLALTSFVCSGFNYEHNWIGGLGNWLVEHNVKNGFGISSFAVPIFLLACVYRLFQIGNRNMWNLRLWKWFLNCAFLMVWFSLFFTFIELTFCKQEGYFLGGMHGTSAKNYLDEHIGKLGTIIVLIATAVAYFLYVTGETARSLRKITTLAQKPLRTDKETEAEEDEESPVVHEPVQTATTISFEHQPDPKALPKIHEHPDIELKLTDTTHTAEEHLPAGDPASTGETAPDTPGMTVTVGTDEDSADLDDTRALEPYDPKLDLENYKYPTIDLLQKYEIERRAVDMAEQKANKERIIKTLRTYGVEISSISATVGPTITLYEITPAPGVRIAKIRNLEDDIALSLSALGIRIIAPIPGKGTIGIEVPNAKPQMVSMESIINSRKFQESEYELPMALGKTITNEIFIVDLAKMPHLLVAGATGQGKSVGLNAIITSLLYKKHPAELKIVMVDPKKVEFSVYSPIVNHFLAQVEGNEDTDEPIITDVNKVVQTLKSLCLEMDTRYDLLKKARVRNIKEYNQKFKDRQLSPKNGHKFMPYIVVIIDEFGDLIMTAGKEIELPIARIAQLARAVGMHMIIATQRPTTNIITGTIKANFPARMAFKTAQSIDSKTILDRPGANQLVGKGDMLFLAGSDPVRLQCAFVDTPEVERISMHIAQQQSYHGPFPLPHVEMEGEESGAADVDLNHLDPMFGEVARLVVSTQQGSTSMIQRKFAIGYNRAGRLMDQLEKAGIVGPAHGSKPREVLCQSEMEVENILNSFG
ncbi:MAG: DNA translocase FtsK 4TM domain-containing protein [Bacteroidaceae bacterium]|nr:DNA translocase FtsK 4TM domain-containing protein [Bacteroidaceae bacterium]